MRDLRILQGSFDELLRSAQDSNQSNEDYVFAELTQSEPVIDAVARLRVVYPNILGLKIHRPQLEPHSTHSNGGYHKIKKSIRAFRGFYKEITGEPLSEQKDC